MPECKDSISSSAQGYLNPKFLGMSKLELDSKSVKDLPKFNDLFAAPEPGLYRVGHVRIEVMRKKKSVLVNDESSGWSLPVDVYYPAAPQLQNGEPIVNPGRQYPVVGFSPGFGATPHQHSHLLEYLASCGYIVISQVSIYLYASAAAKCKVSCKDLTHCKFGADWNDPEVYVSSWPGFVYLYS